jgi:predicted transcriptional regulator
MPTSVLLSVKPAFAEAILDGEKKFEFRRALFRDRGVRTVVLYASSPVQKVVGEFSIDGILSMELDALWAHTETDAGIGRDYFDRYFDGCDTGFALKVRQVHRYPVPLELQRHFGIEHPPQSFRYLASGSTEASVFDPPSGDPDPEMFSSDNCGCDVCTLGG